MKKLFTCKTLLPLLFFTSSFSNLFGQALTEDFSYTSGTALTANGYVAISGAGTNPITVSSPGLSYGGSPSSNIGNAATMTTSGEDLTKVFSPSITSGNAYASFLVNVTSAQATGDYFFILNEGGTFRGRVFIKSSGAGFVFGISKSTASIVYESTVRSFSIIYLVVLKYTFNPVAADDVVSLYVNPTLGLTEPSSTIAPTTNGGSADAVTLDRIALRQGNSANASAQIIDAIRVGTTWSSVTSVSSPTITSISPTSANVGDPGFTLIVNGTNFTNNNSTVTWNGTSRITTFVSATQLTAAIPATDLSTAAVIPVGVTTTGAAAVSNTQNFTINAAAGGTFTLTTALPSFGNVCINTTSTTNSFVLDGNNLNGSAITVSGPTGYTFSENVGGPFNATTPLTYTGTSFANKIIYVQFTPTAIQAYNGNILVNGGGVFNYPVTVTGAGVYDAPFVTTNAATGIGATTATLSGTINSIGCAPITTYGFEYSTNSGFVTGTGTTIPSTNLTAGNFSSTLTGLASNTRYYYKAFAVNSIGTTYGAQMAFTNTALPVPMATQPGLSFTETFADIANWSNFFITGIGANHFTGLGPTGVGNIPNGTTLTASTFSFQNSTPGPPVTPSALGGVHKGTDQTVPTQSIILLSTGTTDNTTSAAIDFYMDFTGVNAGTLSFDYAVVNNQAGDRIGSLRVYASIDGITFTDITFASVLNFTNNIALTGSKSNIALPAIFNNNANARLRFYYSNGIGGTTGSRPKISIDNLNVTALASTPCATPTAAATNLVFGTITDTTIAASFTASNPATDSYLIVMSANSSLISNPINNQNYAIGDNVGDGTVIAKINGTSFTASNLNPLTTYYFFIFPMNAICTGGPLYYTTSILTGSSTTVAGLPNCVAPLTQPTNLMFGTTTSSSIDGSFTATTADKYLVVRSLSASLAATPTNGQNYNSGNTIGNGSVVQNSAITTFTASGLAPNTLYNFFIFSLNSQSCINGPVYNSNNPLTATHSTIPLPLCVTPASQPTNLNLTAANTQVSGTYTGVSGADDYLVIKSTSVTIGTTPIDNTDYAAGDVFGNGTVVTNTGNTTFLANNLSIGTTYYFFVFAANKTCSGGTKYATQSPLAGNIVTTNNPTNNFYFGTLHSHSDYSDGNKDNPGFTPAQDYDYAKNALCMDYLGISEHNHFSSPDNPGNQINNFHQGSVQANNFITANPTFLALYGMEWGVISGGGHVVIYGDGMDDLWGWETGGGTWGPTNNYDVFVPKSIYKGNTGLFKTVNDNIATKTFATLAHPSLGDFNRLDTSYDAIADNAIVGTAVESGPAFSTNTTYSNPGSSLSYLFYYQLMLAKGYRLGPTIDHDNHNTTFGRTTTSRTAIIAPVITKTAFVNAMRNMNFYATQDCDTKVDFTINTKIMGSIITDRSSPNISVSLTDVSTSLSSAIIRLMYGVPGSNINATQIDSSIGNTLQFNHAALADLATGYYYIDVTNGTSRVITSPIWYTRNDALNALPVKLNSFTVQKAGKSAQLDWTTEQETNSSHFIIQRSTDGRKWNDIANVIAAGNSSIRKEYRVYDNAPINGVNYYRLKQFDVDGKFEYSFVKSVSFNKDYNITIAPNPAKDFIYISTTINQNTILTIQLVDVSGKVLKSLQSTQPLVKISTAGIAKGLYFIKIKDENTVQTQRIVIE